MSISPAIAEWLREQLGDKFLSYTGNDDLSAMFLAMKQKHIALPPDDVLTSWHRSLAATRTTLRQSEIEFIRGARGAGWPDIRISEVLGLGPEGSLDTYLEELERLLVEQHPSQRVSPWTGGQWVAPSA